MYLPHPSQVRVMAKPRDENLPCHARHCRSKVEDYNLRVNAWCDMRYAACRRWRSLPPPVYPLRKECACPYPSQVRVMANQRIAPQTPRPLATPHRPSCASCCRTPLRSALRGPQRPTTRVRSGAACLVKGADLPVNFFHWVGQKGESPGASVNLFYGRVVRMTV